MKKSIYADRFFLPCGTAGPGYLQIENSVFGAYSKENPGKKTEDLSGMWVAPGLVDTHIHGMLSHDVMDNSIEGLKKISEGLLACGVTSFLPTTLTADTELLDSVVGTISACKNHMPGAHIEGIFLEGPFFSEKYKGAQNPKYLRLPDIKFLDRWQRLSGGLIKKIAVAPELEGAGNFINHACARNIKVALGHSDATYEQAVEAVQNGASIFVHTYNGMSPFNHRNPGMTGAALNMSNVYAEIICDGHHLHQAAAEIVFKIKDAQHTVLITDCMMAGRMPEGPEYNLGGQTVIVRDGAARLKEGGSLAGSVASLSDALKNVITWGICTPEQAIKTATLTPAMSAGIDGICGQIIPGRRADFIAVTPDMELLATYINGECRYRKEE
jgi:N-acetylglucosamine-6-phosphate deacetylase